MTSTGTRRAAAVVVGDLVIEPVEHVVLHVERMGPGISGLAHKRPVSVVIRSPQGTLRVDLHPEDPPG